MSSKPILPKHAQRRLMRKFGKNDLSPNAKVYFSTPCTCIARNQGTADPKCTICIGGMVYEEPPEEILILRSGMKSARTVSDKLYNLYKGGARITIFPKDGKGNPIRAYDELGQFDVIIVEDTRRATEVCHYKKRDKLYAFNVIKVIKVTETQITKEDGKEQYNLVTFKQGKDFEIELGELVTKFKWLDDGNKPKEFYSVEFICHINYMVWEEMPKQRGPSDAPDTKVMYCVQRAYDNKEINPFMDIETAPPKLANSEE